jgi:hypothetical protein
VHLLRLTAPIMAIPCSQVLLVPWRLLWVLLRQREGRPGLLVPHAGPLLLVWLLLLREGGLVWPLLILLWRLTSTRRPPCTGCASGCWPWASIGRLRRRWERGLLLPGTAAGLVMVPLPRPPLPRCPLVLLLLWPISIPLPPAPCCLRVLGTIAASSCCCCGGHPIGSTSPSCPTH